MLTRVSCGAVAPSHQPPQAHGGDEQRAGHGGRHARVGLFGLCAPKGAWRGLLARCRARCARCGRLFQRVRASALPGAAAGHVDARRQCHHRLPRHHVCVAAAGAWPPGSAVETLVAPPFFRVGELSGPLTSSRAQGPSEKFPWAMFGWALWSVNTDRCASPPDCTRTSARKPPPPQQPSRRRRPLRTPNAAPVFRAAAVCAGAGRWASRRRCRCSTAPSCCRPR